MPHRWFTRKALQTYWRVTRPLTMGAQGNVFDHEGRVLLVRHGYRPGWHFPGGGVEKNETPRTAVVREVEEETGVRALAPPELVGIYANFNAFPSDHIALFVVKEWERAFVPQPNAEIAEHDFFAVDALPDGVIEAVRRRLDELDRSGLADEYW